ncbi:MAG: C40 family peptidase [Lewinella sp.]
MKLPLLFFVALITLNGCSSFRPPSSVRNPSRGGGSATVERSRTPRPAKRPTTARTRKPEKVATLERRSGPTAMVRSELVSQAETLLGIRYKYGGNTPKEGFDCSGFVKYLYNDQGLDIHRVSRDQATQGKPIDPATAQAGDLVFYRRGPNQPVFHVSMIVDAAPGEIWVIHPTSSRGVIRENILASSYWRPKIYNVRDLIR